MVKISCNEVPNRAITLVICNVSIEMRTKRLTLEKNPSRKWNTKPLLLLSQARNGGRNQTGVVKDGFITWFLSIIVTGSPYFVHEFGAVYL